MIETFITGEGAATPDGRLKGTTALTTARVWRAMLAVPGHLEDVPWPAAFLASSRREKLSRESAEALIGLTPRAAA